MAERSVTFDFVDSLLSTPPVRAVLVVTFDERNLACGLRLRLYCLLYKAVAKGNGFSTTASSRRAVMICMAQGGC